MTSTNYATRVALALGIAAAIVIVCAAVVIAMDVILLAFLSIVFAVFLTHLSQRLSDATSLPYRLSVGLLVSSMLLGTIGLGVFCSGRVEDRIRDAEERLSTAVEQLKTHLRDQQFARIVVTSIPGASHFIETDSEKETAGTGNSKREQEDDSSKQTAPSDEAADETSDEAAVGKLNSTAYGMAERIAGVAGRLFAGTFGVLANILFVGFAAIFVAVSPAHYQNGLVRLMPPARRSRVREIANEMSETIWRWTLGRLLAMAITGLGTGLTLWGLGVPLAATLGIVTGILTFVPNVGAIVSLSLAVLVALPEGPETVRWVIILFAALQLVESNMITPLIQQKQVSIPPALLIAFQLLMAALTGLLGVLVATPLLAVAIVAIQRFYIEDVLQDRDGAIG